VTALLGETSLDRGVDAISSIKIKIRRFELDSGEILDREDRIAADAAICIFINGELFRTLLASPVMIEELVVGHLLGEGIIESTDELVSVEVLPLKVYVELREEVDLKRLTMGKVDLITTACGAAVSPSKLRGLGLSAASMKGTIGAEGIWLMARELNLRSGTYKKTGGTHSAMLFSLEGDPLYFSEDVGRHNAVDKVVGAGVIGGLDFRSCVLVSSGRLSGEIVLKATRMGIPVIASVSGPLESGIRIAESAGITLVGFIRGRRFNVYSHKDRIVF
jgi:FdhD protein|tara:strand:- start:31 stop:861 length:831 start_codon:yes stop_codon:yes gene_type:complete